MDAQFILGSIDTMKSMKQLKMGKFGQNAKGKPFENFSKLAIFLVELFFEYPLKSCDFSANCSAFIDCLVAIKTRINSAPSILIGLKCD